MQAVQNLPQVNVPAAQNHAPGIRTFYIASESRSGLEYAVQHIRKPGMRRWQCNCPQFYYRCVARKSHCKHVHLLVLMVRLAHGVSRLAEMGKEEA